MHFRHSTFESAGVKSRTQVVTSLATEVYVKQKILVILSAFAHSRRSEAVLPDIQPSARVDPPGTHAPTQSMCCHTN
ncbi:hypothetical protein AB1N83_005802 [Pleurotus pulmonarius]